MASIRAYNKAMRAAIVAALGEDRAREIIDAMRIGARNEFDALYKTCRLLNLDTDEISRKADADAAPEKPKPITRSGAANYRRLKAFILAADANGGHFTFTAEGFEPLSVENLECVDGDGRPIYSMTHYYEQFGDLMSDPDMTFAVDDAAGTIIPRTYQQDALGIFQEVYDINERPDMRLMREMDGFLAQWSVNILNQGFEPSQAYRKEA